MRNLIVVIVLVLAGCVPTPERPKNVMEQIEVSEIAAQELGVSIARLTCTKFENAVCVEPGKPLDPDEAFNHHATVQVIRSTLRTAAQIDGIGECLGEMRTQAACMQAAQMLLAELDRIIFEAQRRAQ